MDVILVIDDSAAVREAASAWLSGVGYDVRVAKDLKEAQKSVENQRPNLLLVDLSLPNTTGPAVCEALYQQGGIGHVPVVFMATPGDALAQLVSERLPGASILPKPLRFEQLTRKVAQSLERRGETSDEWMQRWAERIVHAPAAERSTMLRACLFAAGLSPDVALSGDLREISAAELFQMLALQAQSGVLRVESSDLELEIHLQGGFVDGVVSRRVVPNLRLGKILVAQGSLAVDHLETALNAPVKPLGDALLSLGLLAQEQLHAALSFQSSELFYELIRQRTGRFSFTVDSTEPDLRTQQQTRLGLNAETLLLEGCRRADESTVLEARVQPRAFVLAKSWHTQDEDDREVLAMCRSPRLVDEVLREAGTSRFQTLQRLNRLVDANKLTMLSSHTAP